MSSRLQAPLPPPPLSSDLTAGISEANFLSSPPLLLSASSLSLSMMTNNTVPTRTSVKKYSCDYDGCGACFAQSNNLKRHKLCHQESVVKLACDTPGCSYKSPRLDNLISHKSRHDPTNLFPCDSDGCSYSRYKYKLNIDSSFKNYST